MENAKLLALWITVALLLQVYAAPAWGASKCRISHIKTKSSPSGATQSDANDSWRIKIEVTNSCKYCAAKGVRVQVLRYDDSSICDVPVGSPVLVKDGKAISPGEKVTLDYYQSIAMVSVYNCLSVKNVTFVNCTR